MATVVDQPFAMPSKGYDYDEKKHKANAKAVEDYALQTQGQLVPVGAIIIYPGATLPTGYLLCDGSAVSRTEYAQLFNVIGSGYGAGDGINTFNLPDFTSSTSTDTRVPVGSGTGRVLGTTTGSILSNAATAQGVGVVVNFLIKT